MSEDSEEVFLKNMSIEQIQSVLDQKNQMCHQKSINEVSEHVKQFPNDFKIIAKDNQNLIHVFKKYVAPKLPYDKQIELFVGQIPEFAQKINDFLDEYLKIREHSNLNDNHCPDSEV